MTEINNTEKDKDVNNIEKIKISSNSRILPQQWKALEDAEKLIKEVRQKRLDRRIRLGIKN